MIKTRKLTFLRIEQILTVLLFAFMIYCKRELIINSFERQVELSSNKFEPPKKDKLNKNYKEFFLNKVKKDFSTQVNLLIVIMIWGVLMILNMQRRIYNEKNKKLE